MATETLTTSGTWTRPTVCKNLVVKVYGGGGGGGSSSATKSNGSGAGGGGGAFTSVTIATPNASYDYVVGTAGIAGAGGATATDGGAGGFSWWGTTTTCYSKGGGGGAKGLVDADSTAGIAGTADYGTVKYAGGAGFKGVGGSTATGGGGGGSGGTGSVGNTATDINGAGAVTGGYNGGMGGAVHAVGVAPTGAYGGGGGGGGHSNTTSTALAGGAGKPGVIFLDYTLGLLPTPSDSNSASWISAVLAKMVIFAVVAEASAGYTEAITSKLPCDAIIAEANSAYTETVGAQFDYFASIGEANTAYTEAPSALFRYKAEIGEANAAYAEEVIESHPGTLSQAWRDAALVDVTAPASVAEANTAYTEAIDARFTYQASIAEANTAYTEAPLIRQNYRAGIAEANAAYTDTPVIFQPQRAGPAEANTAYTEGVTAFETIFGLIDEDGSNWDEAVDKDLPQVGTTPIDVPVSETSNYWLEAVSGRQLYRASIGESLNLWDEGIAKSLPASGSTPIDVTPPADSLNLWTEAISGRETYRAGVSETLNAWLETSLVREPIKPAIGESFNNWTEAITDREPIRTLVSETLNLWAEAPVVREPIRTSVGESLNNWTEAITSRKPIQALLSEDLNNWLETISVTTDMMLSLPVTVGESLNFWAETPAQIVMLRNARTLTIADGSPWTAPLTASTMEVECYGAGAAGGGSYSQNSTGSGGGGGGGAYSKLAILNPTGDYAFVVGVKGTGVTGGKGNNGGASWFKSNDAAGCVAAGGTGGNQGTSTASGTGGSGGLLAAGYGTTLYSGGNGASGVYNSYGGGGGESASYGGNGFSAFSRLGGTGALGDDGAAGGLSHAVGGTASGYGAGGGGAGHRQGATLAGGNGSNGKIFLKWSEYPCLALEYPIVGEDLNNWTDSVEILCRNLVLPAEANQPYSETPSKDIVEFKAWRESVVHQVKEVYVGAIPKTISESNAPYSESLNLFKTFRAQVSDSTVLSETITRQINYQTVRNKAWWDEVEAVVITDITFSPLHILISDSNSANWVDSVKPVKRLLLNPSDAFVNTVPLTWDASPSSDVIGYRIFYDTHTAPDSYYFDVGLVTSCNLTITAPGLWYITVYAHDSEDLYSDPSNEVTEIVAGYVDTATVRHRSTARPSDSFAPTENVHHNKVTIIVLTPLDVEIGEANGPYTEIVAGSGGPIFVNIDESFQYSDSVNAFYPIYATISEANGTYTETITALDPKPQVIAETANFWNEYIHLHKHSITIITPITVEISGDYLDPIDGVPSALVPTALLKTISESNVASESILVREPIRVNVGESSNYWQEGFHYSGIYVQIGFILEDLVSFPWADSANYSVVTVAPIPGNKWIRNWKKHA
jgi:hypothetical protein